MISAEGRAIYENAYSGYPGSTKLPTYFDLRIAGGLLYEAIDGLKWTERSAGESDLATLLTRTKDFGSDVWWVQERLLLMIRTIGDERFLPLLKSVIQGEIKVVSRRHLYAIDAYARISGHDLRPDNFEENDVEAVRDRYLRHFQEK